MDRKRRKLRRFEAGVAAMSADERAALKAAMARAQAMEDRKMWNLVTDIAAALGRTVKRRESDRRTEAARRRLVGARLPVSQAERCRRCAGLLGVSQYRFTVEALERECRRVEKSRGMEWNGECHRLVILE